MTSGTIIHCDVPKTVRGFAGRTVTCANGHAVLTFLDAPTAFGTRGDPAIQWHQAEPECGEYPRCEVCGAKWTRQRTSRSHGDVVFTGYTELHIAGIGWAAIQDMERGKADGE